MAIKMPILYITILTKHSQRNLDLRRKIFTSSLLLKRFQHRITNMTGIYDLCLIAVKWLRLVRLIQIEPRPRQTGALCIYLKRAR